MLYYAKHQFSSSLHTGPTKRSQIKEGLLWWDLSKNKADILAERSVSVKPFSQPGSCKQLPLRDYRLIKFSDSETLHLSKVEFIFRNACGLNSLSLFKTDADVRMFPAFLDRACCEKLPMGLTRKNSVRVN